MSVRRMWWDGFGLRLGVRLRSALAASVVVAVASLVAGGVLVVAVHGVLLANVDTAVNDRANQVAAALKNGNLADQLRPSPRDRTVVQVLDTQGHVIAGSDAIAGQDPISASRPVAGASVHQTHSLHFAEDEPFRIVALGVSTAQGQRTVLVGESFDAVNDGTGATLVAMLVGLPLLALVVGAATFQFVGATLRPVEAMRARAAGITSRSLHDRLPVPGTADEIAALATTMNTMLDRIEAASDAQRRFVADASHELRSPLATIRANADLLDGVPLGDGPRRAVERIRSEGVRMSRLVEDLLLLARFDDSGVRLRRQDVDLDDLVYAERDRLAIVRPDLTVLVAVEPVRVTGDPDALQRVLRNLVDNAARHATGSITLSVRARRESPADASDTPTAGTLVTSANGKPPASVRGKRAGGRPTATPNGKPSEIPNGKPGGPIVEPHVNAGGNSAAGTNGRPAINGNGSVSGGKLPSDPGRELPVGPHDVLPTEPGAELPVGAGAGLPVGAGGEPPVGPRGKSPVGPGGELPFGAGQELAELPVGEIVVANDGPPIPGADRARVFDRFVRLDDSRSRAGGGTGLGLPIARDIVAAHHGTLTIDDRADGVTVRIRLPLDSANLFLQDVGL